MYLVQPFLAQPRDDAGLWRYMTPSAFLSLLSGVRFFSRPLELSTIRSKACHRLP